MFKAPLITCIFFMLTLAPLEGQRTFPEMVARTFGTDQDLVNGIQFSNQYKRIDGDPYFLDGGFRIGSVFVNNQWHEPMMIRYNLYSQKVEIEYRSIDGNLNQYMSVPEKMESFTLEGYRFKHMLFPGEEPRYYQVVTSGGSTGYIGWRKDMRLSRTSMAREYEFTPLMVSYWLVLEKNPMLEEKPVLEQQPGLEEKPVLEQQPLPFHNRKTFLDIFPPEMRKELSRLLKSTSYSFRYPSISEAGEMINAALQLYEKEHSP